MVFKEAWINYYPAN
ncbi:uncharacterized protein FFFS_03132 [Fusarium fujikuroi]|nr:uncharacterized protein FFFS_03132 [Fusarium fujikuroi]